MYPYIVLFGHSFSSYSLFAFLGLIAGMIFCFLISVKAKLSFKTNIFFLIFGIPTAFIGAFLLYYISRIKDLAYAIEFLFSDFDYFISIMSVGFVFYGGLFGFLFGMMIYANVANSDMREEFFYLTPVFPLFHIFGRIGCYFAGCCYGKNGIPIQLIEAALNLVIFIITYQSLKKKTNYFRPIGLYFVMYGTIRFILEFFRGDEIRGLFAGLSTSQWISLFVIPLGIYNLVKNNENNHFSKWYDGTK